jgi:hypothetical protein
MITYLEQQCQHAENHPDEEHGIRWLCVDVYHWAVILLDFPRPSWVACGPLVVCELSAATCASESETALLTLEAVRAVI